MVPFLAAVLLVCMWTGREGARAGEDVTTMKPGNNSPLNSGECEEDPLGGLWRPIPDSEAVVTAELLENGTTGTAVEFEGYEQRIVPSLREYYALQLMDHPTLEGTLTVEIQASSHGWVDSVTVNESTFADSLTTKALVTPLRSYQFPKVATGDEARRFVVRYTFVPKSEK